MKPIPCKAVLLLVFGTVVRGEGHPPTSESRLGVLEGGDAESGDLEIVESHPALSYLAAPPRYEGPPNHRGREWRIPLGPPPLSSWNPSGYNVRQTVRLPFPKSIPQSSSNPNLDFRLNHFPNKREHYYPTTPPRPVQKFFSPYAPVDEEEVHQRRNQDERFHQNPQYHQPHSGDPRFSQESRGHEERQEGLREKFYVRQPQRQIVHQGELVYHEHRDGSLLDDRRVTNHETQEGGDHNPHEGDRIFHESDHTVHESHPNPHASDQNLHKEDRNPPESQHNPQERDHILHDHTPHESGHFPHEGDHILNEGDHTPHEGDHIFHERDPNPHESDRNLYEEDLILHEGDHELYESDHNPQENDRNLHERDRILHEEDHVPHESDHNPHGRDPNLPEIHHDPHERAHHSLPHGSDHTPHESDGNQREGNHTPRENNQNPHEGDHNQHKRQNSDYVTEQGPKEVLGFDDHIFGENNGEAEDPPSTNVPEGHFEETTTPVTRPAFLQPGNLAALLAGAGTIGLKNQETDEESAPQVDEPEKKRESTSKTRTVVPEHILRHETYPDSDYYDELYDEFVDTYYDPEGKTDSKIKGFRIFVEEKMRRNSSAHGKQKENAKGHKLTSKIETSAPPSETETPDSSSSLTTPEAITPLKTSKASTTSTTTTTTTSTSTSLKTTSSDVPSLSTTPKQEKTKEVTTSTAATTYPPISLSEVLQELGLSLSQFLSTLKVHGSSLKEFTAKLQGKSLSKSEFRRAKGNVKKLLEILESSPDRISRTRFTRPEQTTVSETTSTEGTTSSSPETTVPTTSREPARTTAVVDKTTESTVKTTKTTETTGTAEVTEAVSQEPRIFGSRPSGISMTKLESEKPEQEDKTKNSSRVKPPIIVELDIAKLVKEKGVSAAGILQEFKNMFNISQPGQQQNRPKLTTSKPLVKDETTTKKLRPYRPGAERLRPYRPLDYERGNSKIYRGIVNHRLSSTARPTLRPPYVFSPPSINYGESVDEVDAKDFTKKEETTHEEDSNSKIIDETSIFEHKHNQKLYNYNIVKSSPESLDVSTRSAIMAAGILGGVALSVFIAIFIVVKYRNHMHRHRRRMPLTLPSDSSSSSLPPIYASRSIATAYSKECYQTSGFWTTLKKRFDPYSPSSSPSSM